MRCYATFYLSFSTICSVDSLFSSADAFLWENLGDRECVLGDSGGFGILWCSSERMCSLSPLEEEKEVNNINLNKVEPIENGLFGFWGWRCFPRNTKRLWCGKTGQQKRANCFATLPQNELNSDVARFASHVQNCLATTQVRQVAKICCRKCL